MSSQANVTAPKSSHQPDAAPRPRRIVRWYKGAAILLLNTLVFFIILNLVLWAGISIRRIVLHRENPALEKYSPDLLRQVYTDMSETEFRQLLTESFRRPFTFEQWVQIREAPFQGKYVNVSEHGFRKVPQQGPWPIDPNNYNVFMFGGSTTFGYGVRDDQTLPACVQRMLAARGVANKRVCIYNFGRGYYYSTPERILFEQLLINGAKPNLAIFTDGLNDFYHPDDVLENTPELKKAMEPSVPKAVTNHILAVLMKLPVGEAAEFIGSRIIAPARPGKGDPAVLATVINRYVFNKTAIELIARNHGIATVFVFQPVPYYLYDQNHHLFRGNVMIYHDVTVGYPMMVEHMKQHPMGDGFLWLADIQKDQAKPLYCDQVHYTPEFTNQIAGEIVKFIDSRKLLPP